jgi:hypothetical protein
VVLYFSLAYFEVPKYSKEGIKKIEILDYGVKIGYKWTS